MISIAESDIKQGDLVSALAQLQSNVREDPSNPAYRVFLFQLLAVMGDWNRSLTQLNVAVDLDSENVLMGQTYRELLQCENYRSAVFAGKRAPLFIGEPPEWMAKLVQSLTLSAIENGSEAKVLVDSAFDAAESFEGHVNGIPFQWICDADMRLGPIVEAIINGKYYWIPFGDIAKLDIYEPEDLRDLVWIPAKFAWRSEGTAVGFIPARYSGIRTLEDPQNSLCRRTEWKNIGDEFYTGAGQRTFTTDVDDYSLLQVRSIEFSNTRST